MRLVADMHVSPRTVEHLRANRHDVIRVSAALRPTATDEEILSFAETDGRAVLTQDLDFSRLVAASGRNGPSIISLRLSSSRIGHVNGVLDRVLPTLERVVTGGIVVTVEDHRVRQRSLPVA